MNYWKLLIFLFITNTIFSQKFVKQDSSKLIVHKAVKYFNSDLNTFFPVNNKLEENHYIYPLQGTYSESYVLGNIGSELFPIAYQHVFYETINSGRNLLNPYFYSKDNIPFYLSNKAISELNFTLFGNGNETFSGFFTQNLNPHLQVSAGIKRSNNKGFFQYNQTLHNNFYFSLVHQNKRMRSNLTFTYNDANIRENGGNTFGIYDSVGYKEFAFSPTNLTSAINKFVNYELSLSNRLLIVKDYTKDSVLDSIFNKPIKSPFYIENEISYSKDKNSYSDTINSTNRDYYNKLFNDTPTVKINSIYSNIALQNTFSIHSDIRKIGRIKLYNKLILNNIYRSAFEDYSLNTTESIVVAFGGKMDVFLPLGIIWSNHIFKPISGYTSNDFLISSSIDKATNYFKFNFKSSYTSQLPGYFINNFETSWASINNNLINQKTIEFSGKIESEKYKLGIQIQNYNIINFLYLNQFNEFKQDIDNNILQINLQKEFNFKSLYTKTALIYQNSYYSKIWLKQTFGIKNRAFKDNLNYNIGIDITLNNNQNVLNYNPFMMQYSDVLNPKKTKLVPILDLFVSAKINSVLLSLNFSNIMSSGTYFTYNYPIIPNTFYLRLNWRFLE